MAPDSGPSLEPKLGWADDVNDADEDDDAYDDNDDNDDNEGDNDSGDLTDGASPTSYGLFLPR